MKKSKVLALLLSLSLFCTMVLSNITTYADDNGTSPSNSGMEIRKTATDNGNGTYTITLEAYATGEKVIDKVEKDVPTDIVLVLDQSGSMANQIGTVSFEQYEDETYYGYVIHHTRNQDYYEVRANGENPNLYYQLDDGSYVSVSVTVQQNISYTEIKKGYNNSDYNGATNYWDNRNNLYAKVNGEYLKVAVDRTSRYGTYTYTLPDDTEIGRATGQSASPTFNRIDGTHLYLASVDESQNVYTYTYMDADGKVQTIGTSTGADTQPKYVFYKKVINTNAGGTRLNALKTAVTTFADSVAKKAAGKDGQLGTEDDVNHRIAMVGFSCSNTGNNNNYNNYQNTEVFIGSTQYKYGTTAQGQYKNALQSMNTTQGQSNVTASIGALDADGATYVNHGLEMANGILNANPVPEGEKRNRVVIVFTDGVPGYSDFDSTVADSAITKANTTRSLGANVYAVGIFSGADATSAGNQNGTDAQKANWFMQNLSDNKGTPQTPSYYLSAADSNTLNNIFKQIADNIESGGSSSTLNEEAVIKDIIAPQFQLPTGATSANITLETYKYTGENQWSKNTDAMGAKATIDGAQVSVTGFNFSENWCGTETNNGNTTYRGNKLVISFPVVVKEGFLGGNGVYTNSKAGVYENANSINPVLEFERPQVDVAIENVTVTPENKNVYLLGSLTGAQLKENAAVDVGGVTFDLTKPTENWGLEFWQNEYVNIAVEIKDKAGNVIASDLTGLTEDSEYTVFVTVSPKAEGTATEKSGSGKGKINVFKPELTFKDGEVYYGDTVPTDFTGNLVSTVWKHGETLSDAKGVTVIGSAPDLALTHTPDANKIADSKINTKQDVPVDVTVKIGNTDVTDKTSFQHTNCEGKTCTVPSDFEFLLHVKTCQLTITKRGGDSDEPYVFTVYKDGKEYTEVTIVGNNSVTIYELPVGTYTIEEDTGWSWRYNPAYTGNGVTLSKDIASGTITCTNTPNNKIYWLNGFSEVVENIFEAITTN